MLRLTPCRNGLALTFLFLSACPIWAASGFITAPAYSVADSPSAGVTGDFNGDGALDIVTVNGVIGNLSTLLGNGKGKFGKAINSGRKVMGGEAIAAADFNGDGHLDVVVVGTPNLFTLLLGDGSGGFSVKTSVILGGEGLSVAAGDLNGDGKLDVAVATTANVSVLLGNGDGTFQPAKNFKAGPGPQGLRIEDFNQDGKLDLAVANSASPGGLDVLLGKGDGTFQTPTTIGTTFYVAVTSADVNLDGKIDLVAVSSTNLVTVFLGQGNGSFQAGVTYDNGTTSRAIAVGDVNGDGKPDLIAGRESGISILAGNGDGTFQAPTEYSSGDMATGVLVGDFNGDQKLDVATPDTLALQVSVLLNKGDGTFVAARQFEAGDFLALTSEAAVAADFNGDGKKDVAVLTSGTKIGVQVLFGNGDGTLQSPIFTAAGINPTAVAKGDFNKDHKMDLAIVDSARSEVIILLGNGDGTFATGAIYFPVGSPDGVTTADVNGDGVLDVLVATTHPTIPADNTMEVFLGKGNGTFQAGVPYVIPGTLAQRIVVGDINGDGKMDAIMGCLDIDASLQTDIFVFLGNGDGTFQSPVGLSVGKTTDGLALVDFNGDGKLDLAVNDTTFTDVLLGNGDGTFQSASSIGLGGSGLIALDVNGDRKTDLAIVDFRGNTQVFSGNGDGTFATGKLFGTGALSLTDKADFNHDGADDLLATTFMGNSVTVVLNAR